MIDTSFDNATRVEGAEITFPEFTLPISKNAYKRFVGQIYAVFGDDPNCGRIIYALNRYLEGDREFYLDRLPEQYRMAFEMLSFEIDAAIERSAKAKERARLRRNLTQRCGELQREVLPSTPDGRGLAQRNLAQRGAETRGKVLPSTTEAHGLAQRNLTQRGGESQREVLPSTPEGAGRSGPSRREMRSADLFGDVGGEVGFEVGEVRG